MKKALLTLSLVLIAAMGSAQQPMDSLRIHPSQISLDDLLWQMESQGKYLKKIDLTSLEEVNPRIELRVSVYHGRDSVNHLLSQELGSILRILPWGDTVVSKNLLFGFLPLNDSTNQVSYNFEGQRGGSLTWKREKPHENLVRSLDYVLRPFRFDALTPNEFAPLFLVGSTWYDERYNIFRFCMENQMEPDLSNDAFDKMPHYMIVSIRAIVD